MSGRPLRRDVRIIQSSHRRDEAQRPPVVADVRERDARPGMFAVYGPFIRLPNATADVGNGQSNR
jgi:hypothetical protein